MISAPATTATSELAPGPGPDAVMQMVMGFMATQTLLAADELNVFELLKEGGKTSGEILAFVDGADPGAFERLLNGLTGYGLLSRNGDEYQLTRTALSFLVKGQPGYVGGFFAHIRADLYELWRHLPHAVAEGKPQWGRLEGANPAGPFESMYASEQGVQDFMDAMFSNSFGGACEYAEHFDFSRFAHIVDIGGASGAFFAGVMPKHPDIKGTIFDLPPVEKPARDRMEKYGLADRVDFVAGNFFTDPLPAHGDLYILGNILHDWNTEQGTALLRKIYDVLPEGGAVFINEALLNENKSGPAPATTMDLNMLVATTGKERTAAEYQQWLKEIGYSRTEYRVCQFHKDYVVGYK